MYYAKSNPVETITEHINKLLENMNLLKEIYGSQILKSIDNKERFWILLEIVRKYHDIGKVFTPFQNEIRKRLKVPLLKTKFEYGTIKHEQLSPMFIPIKKYNLSEDEKRLVYQAIYYHHERDYKDINNTYVQEILEEDILPKLDKIKSEISVEIEENMNCMYIKYIQNRNRIKEDDQLFIEYCLLKGILHRLDYCSSANIEVEENIVENVSDYVNVFMENKNYNKNALQKFCEGNSANNLLVIGSTGIGKTEASLLWSNGCKTFLTLPIRTSINAIFNRIQDDIKYTHMGLLHSTALEFLKEKNDLKDQEELYRQSKNLCKNITVCTIDQIFPFVFKYKGYEKIYATLCYSKVIIDEVQAYSPEIVVIILKGLEMIYKGGGSFMIMTATLPQIYRKELEKLGIEFKFNKFLMETKRHKIKIEDKDILEDLENIKKQAKHSKILIIANTVNKAIDIYLRLEKEKVFNINLLHSKFIYSDRKNKAVF